MLGDKQVALEMHQETKIIASYAFDGFARLTYVIIPDSVTSIGSYAFNNCSSLTSVVIGDSVTTIGDLAFGGCSNLTSVVISDSVTTIAWAAFAGCSSLTSIKYCGSSSQWNAISKSYNWDYNSGNYTVTYNYQG